MKAIEFAKEEKDIIAKRCFPRGASKEDVEYGILLAEHLGLNPLTKEIMFVERSQKVNGQWITKVEPLVGRDGFLAIAHRSGQFDGMETTVELKEVPVLKNGKWEVQKDLVAITKVYRKDTSHPVMVTVSFNEYAQYNKEGHLTTFWRAKPKTMLGKVTESQALRKAFNISGVYSPEEMAQDIDVAESIAEETKADMPTMQKPQPQEPEKESPKQAQQKPEQPKQESKPDILQPPSAKIDSFEEKKKAVEALGLTLNEKGFAEGKTYGKSKELKGLGFTWDSATKKWWLKEIVKNKVA